MHVLISAVGSAGDVYPFIAIARVLRGRGHDAQLLASPRFRTRVEQSGIGFVPFGTDAEYERVVRLPALWHPRRGLRLILRELLDRLAASYAATVALVRPHETVLVGSTLAWNVRLVQDRLGVPAATVHLSPSCLASATLPPVLPGVGDLSGWPRWLVRLVQSSAERLLLDPMIAPDLDRIRGQLGLEPVRHVASRWMHSPTLVIGAWPEWFGPSQTDWPPQAQTAGFALLRPAAGQPLEPALLDFLRDGPAPVGFTPGSAMAHGRVFFERAVEACALTGRRAVLVTPYADQLPSPLPASAHHTAYAPFDELLPRLSLLVHHGGVGTCAEALAAGVPQVVVPFAHDQFDNAARLQRLGVAVSLQAQSRVGRWVAALESVESKGTAAAVRVAAERMGNPATALRTIADRIETLARATDR